MHVAHSFPINQQTFKHLIQIEILSAGITEIDLSHSASGGGGLSWEGTDLGSDPCTKQTAEGTELWFPTVL